jgi:hypothetical protein
MKLIISYPTPASSARASWLLISRLAARFVHPSTTGERLFSRTARVSTRASKSAAATA